MQHKLFIVFTVLLLLYGLYSLFNGDQSYFSFGTHLLFESEFI